MAEIDRLANCLYIVNLTPDLVSFALLHHAQRFSDKSSQAAQAYERYLQVKRGIGANDVITGVTTSLPDSRGRKIDISFRMGVSLTSFNGLDVKALKFPEDLDEFGNLDRLTRLTLESLVACSAIKA